MKVGERETSSSVGDRTLIVVDAQYAFASEWLSNDGRLQHSGLTRALNCDYALKVATRYANHGDSPLWGRYALTDDMPASRLIPDVERTADIVLTKDTYSAANSKLFALLERCGIDKVDVCGFDTDACVLATVVGLFDAGYDVRVLGDACWSSSGNAAHRQGLDVMRRMLIDVV